MSWETSEGFVDDLGSRWGRLKRLPRSRSLFEIAGRVRVYRRYSKLHAESTAFFGLRQVDLQQLEGFPSFICLVWEGQSAPLVIPYEDFQEIFSTVEPARDGQYKVHVDLRKEGTDLRIVQAGRFGVDAYFGTDRLVAAVENSGELEEIPNLSHSQVQSMIGAIGSQSGYAVWTPANDRASLDFSLVDRFPCVAALPEFGNPFLRNVVEQIDVLWIDKRRNTIAAAFEVEFSTPIYSGLLRFIDIHIDFKLPRAAVIAHEERRSAFVRQVNRRTFQASGLSDICSFYEYTDVYRWFTRSCLPRRSGK